MRVTPTVDGTPCELDVEPPQTLVDALRESCGVAGIRRDCTDGTCGACAVLVDGEAIRSCLMLAVQCHGAQIRTAAKVGS